MSTAISQSIDSLLKAATPYSVSAGLHYDDNGNIAGLGELEYKGDMSGDIWKPTNVMGRDTFLKLFITQLQYQDPLDPMDNSAMVSQLAQFTALENSVNTEKAISELKEAFVDSINTQMLSATSVANSSAMSLIGKEVRMRQVTVSFDGKADAQIPIRVHLGNAESATVEIRNADGEVIRTLKATGKDAENSVTVYWDGEMNNGEKAKVGNYLLEVQGSKTNPALYPFVQSVVEGVRFTDTGVLVKINGREISIGEVLDVSMGKAGDGGYISQSSALSLMGKQVRAKSDTIKHNGSDDAEYGIMVQGPANQQVNVEIRDSEGRLVTTLRGHTTDSGRMQVYWDGTMVGGDVAAPAGNYKVHIVGSEKNPGWYSYTEGVVDGLTSLTGDFKLKVGGMEIAVGDVLEISTPKS